MGMDFRSPSLGKNGKWAAQRVQRPRSGDEAWSDDESVSSSGSRESDVCNEALRVIGLYGLGDKVSLFLKDWELARVTLSCHMALDMLCQGMHEALCHSKKSLLSPRTGCDK